MDNEPMTRRIQRIVIVNLLCQYVTLAQIQITGSVITTDSVPVSNAQIKFIDETDSSRVFTALTDSTGYYNLMLITSVGEEPKFPKNFQLHPNYPNPFSTETEIVYELSQPTDVEFKIYDVTGRLVKTVVTSQTQMGTNSVVWDGRDQKGQRLSAGVYFYVLSTKNGIAVQKMLYFPSLSSGFVPTFLPHHTQSVRLVRQTNEPSSYAVVVKNTVTTNYLFKKQRYETVFIERDSTFDFHVTQVDSNDWEDLEFGEKLPVRMILAEPYLYVAASIDGLWRRDLRQMTPWEYLGLSDSTTARYENFGVVDVDVKGGDILISFMDDTLRETSIGIWRSTDAGQTWFRSDSGIPDSSCPYSYMQTAQRSPHNLQLAYSFGSSWFHSTNSGYTWEVREPHGYRCFAIGYPTYLTWNPYRSGEVWLYGATPSWTPILYRSTDYGLTWTYLGSPFEISNDIRAVAFDAIDTNTIYIAAIYPGVAKSTNRGQTWITPLGNPPIRAISITNHPSIHDIVYFGWDDFIYRTTDGAGKTQKIYFPKNGAVYSSVYDEKTESILIGTIRTIQEPDTAYRIGTGIYRLKSQ